MGWVILTQNEVYFRFSQKVPIGTQTNFLTFPISMLIMFCKKKIGLLAIIDFLILTFIPKTAELGHFDPKLPTCVEFAAQRFLELQTSFSPPFMDIGVNWTILSRSTVGLNLFR